MTPEFDDRTGACGRFKGAGTCELTWTDPEEGAMEFGMVEVLVDCASDAKLEGGASD